MAATNRMRSRLAVAPDLRPPMVAATRSPATMLVLCISLVMADAGSARSLQCSKADFEAVVDEAAASLRTLNQINRPRFQTRVRELANKRGWTHDQLMSNGAELVRDEKIEEFDQRSDRLLQRISNMGDAGRNAREPDCRLLDELRGHMRDLIEMQQAKWTYMLDKLAREQAK